MPLDIVRLAMQAVCRNPLRSVLNIIGIVVGIGAVTALAAIGNGTARKVEAQIAALGADLLTLRVGQSARAGSVVRLEAKPFDYRDVDALRTHVAGLRTVVPLASSTQRVVAWRNNLSATVIGTETAYFAARGWQLASGRHFTPAEISTGKPVCLIGETVRRNLFATKDALGRLVRVGNMPCTVVGLLVGRGQTSGSVDDDNTVAMPIDSYLRRIQGSRDLGAVLLAAASPGSVDRVKLRAESLMRERRGLLAGQIDDFTILDSRHVAETMRSTGGALRLMLGAIAVIGLLIGGVGIMNMMLASVTERTREIGIRLAVGALPWQVRLQFLSEAVLLATSGGVIGAVLGVATAVGVARHLELPFVIDMTLLGLALTVAVLVGAVSGLVPASRAARMRPIDALRHA